MVLVGHSMGGLIAQETYVRYPKLIKALALCFTSPAFAGGSSEFTQEVHRRAHRPARPGQDHGGNRREI